MFGRSYLRILSGTQIFSLSHAPDMLIISFSQRRFMLRQWSLPKYFPSKAKWILRRYSDFFLGAGDKKFQRANATAVRVWCNWIHPTIGWRRRGWARDSQTRARLVDSLLCITCSLENNAFSVLHYVIKVTLHYLMLHRFEIHQNFRAQLY